ncbi:MAG TPA: S49 family peptidase [Anaerolineae bacterium]|nr:S49 family peptidase [Anaerolineae bacterium]
MTTVSPSHRRWRIIVWLLVFVLVGLVSACLAAWLIPRPAVGIIRVNIDIFATGTDYSFGSMELFQAEIDRARQDRRIKAVVVQFDSPGGEVVASQTLYLELQALRRSMPVVGAINTMAASGAYYAAMATEPLYARPSSSVGNVGVWGYFPDDLAVNDVILASGPFKLSGSNRDEFLREIEGIKQEFIATVTSQRGERLQITSVDLSQGLMYPGREALNLGLVDRLGTQSDAVAEAARQAGIAHYEVIDLEAAVINAYFQNESLFLHPWAGAADPATGKRTVPPGIYLLYDVSLRGEP